MSKQAVMSFYDKLPNGQGGRLNYQAFVDTYVDTNGNRALAIQAAGYQGEDYAGNSQAILRKPEVKRAIAERAANQFFAQLPLGMKVIQDVLESEHVGEVVDKKTKKTHKIVNMKMLELKARIALKMFELVQVKELAAANMALKAATKKVDLNELADKLAGLVAEGGIAEGAFGEAIAGRSSGISGFGGVDRDSGEDDEYLSVQALR